MIQEELKNYLNYDKETGIFTWNNPISFKVKKGQVAGSPSHGYIGIRIKTKLYLAHRLAYIYENGDIQEGLVIDHINGNRKDNRIINLRAITQQENAYNTIKPHKNSSHKCIVTTFDKNAWLSRIRVGGKRITIGRFKTKEEGTKAYLEAKKIYHTCCNLF